MKRVLIPVGSLSHPPETKYPFTALRQKYVEKLREHCLQPLLVPSYTNEEELEDYLSLCSGILFTGGPDFDPKYYGQEKHAKTLAIDPGRDKIELLILKKILDERREIPFLGICRGIQAAAIVGGGELYQHLPDITKEKHGEPEGSSYDHLSETPKHTVHLTPGSKIHAVFGRESIEMNTGHHQAVKNPGDFLVTGITEGGIIEVLEHPERGNFVAVQCHAELQPDLNPLFSAFAEDVRSFSARYVNVFR